MSVFDEIRAWQNRRWLSDVSTESELGLDPADYLAAIGEQSSRQHWPPRVTVSSDSANNMVWLEWARSPAYG